MNDYVFPNIGTNTIIVGSVLLLMSAPVCANSSDIINCNKLVSKGLSIIEFSKPVTFRPFDERLKKIQSLSSNWDGYGAVSIDMAVYCNARDFLEKLDNKLLDCLREDNISPTPYGTITLDFECQENLVSVEIGKSEIGFFTDFSNKKNRKSNGDYFFNKIIPAYLKQSLIDLIS